MIQRLRVIAVAALRESLRSRLFLSLLVVYSLTLIAIAIIAAGSLSGETRIFHDLSHLALSISGSMVALFVGVGLIAADIERKTLHLILARPVKRAELIVGKFLGLALLLLLYDFAASLLYAVVAAGGPDTVVTGPGIASMFLLVFEFFIIAAVSMLFASLSNASTASVYGLLFFIVGRLGDSIHFLAERSSSPLYRQLAHYIRMLMPDLTTFDLNPRLPMPDLLHLSNSLAYGLMWTTVLLALAVAAFQRRDLK